jgi:hypothetical protein
VGAEITANQLLIQEQDVMTVGIQYNNQELEVLESDYLVQVQQSQQNN